MLKEQQHRCSKKMGTFALSRFHRLGLGGDSGCVFARLRKVGNGGLV
jgi:hypothetical protein